MSNRQSIPIQLHTADYSQKAKLLKAKPAWSARVWALLFGALLIFLLIMKAPSFAQAAQQYQYAVSVETGAAARVDMPVDAPLDLSTFLGGLAGTLDPASLQVVEVDSLGGVLDSSVLFQFDAAVGFDPSTNPVGNLVFVMNDSTPSMSIRHYRVLFDVVGACGDCPPPPTVPVPTTVDSLIYEGQLTYLVDTPRADYYYHLAGAGLASIIDNDGDDWISFHAIDGSRETGEYRGIPNLVNTPFDPDNSFYHPGASNSTSTLVNHGPLKVSVRSVTNNPVNEWIVLWEFYPNFARMTVEQVGTSNGGAYWFLYEGTPGGSLDSGDIIVRSDGTISSAGNNNEQWEMALDDPQWVYFNDFAGPRYFYLSDDLGDTAPDAHRAMGQLSGPAAGMTVFGLGRVLPSSPNSLTPRLVGADRSFTLGFGEDQTTATAEINGAFMALNVTVGDPVDNLSAVGNELPRGLRLDQNYPNPFNPATTIRFRLPSAGAVNLAVYDAAGRLVRTLVDGELAAGPHAYLWDGQDHRGRMAPSGIYLSRLISADRVLRGKMTLVE